MAKCSFCFQAIDSRFFFSYKQPLLNWLIISSLPLCFVYIFFTRFLYTQIDHPSWYVRTMYYQLETSQGI